METGPEAPQVQDGTLDIPIIGDSGGLCVGREKTQV